MSAAAELLVIYRYLYRRTLSYFHFKVSGTAQEDILLLRTCVLYHGEAIVPA